MSDTSTDTTSDRFRLRRLVGGAELAWCASVRKGEPVPDVIAGEMVETTPHGFFAGAWDGPYEDFAFSDAYTVMGTGGRVTSAGLHVSSPSHPCDSVYTLDAGDQLLVSNSLPFLFARADDAPDPGYRRYRIDMAKLWRAGRAGSPLSLPTARGRRLDMHLLTDLLINHEGEVKLVEKPLPSAPQSFADLRRFLAESVQRLATNGTDSARRYPLRAVATISNGFDSSASAVLAAEAGVKEAATFARTDDVDSGAALAARLGMRVTELDVAAWRSDASLPEIDFSASTGGSLQLSMAALSTFRNAMIFTGHLGELTWAADTRNAHDAFAAPTPFVFDAWSQHDFFVRAGIVGVYVPTIGGFQAEALGRITDSDEMKPFHLGSGNERPIARRILEDCGIPRGSFATQKFHGLGLNPTHPMSDAAENDFRQWWRALGHRISPLRRWRYRFEGAAVTPSIKLVADALFKTGRGRTLRRALRYRQYFWSVPGSYRFHWAVERLIDRFRAAMPESD